MQQEILSIHQRVRALEQHFIEQHQRDILQISSALSIAKASGITSHEALASGMVNDSNRFLLGTKILDSLLETKKSELTSFQFISRPAAEDKNKPLIASVSQLYQTLQALQNKNIDLQSLQPITIDEPAQVPQNPIKPKKKLIVALGVVLGGMLGVFIALIQIAMASHREQLQASPTNLSLNSQ